MRFHMGVSFSWRTLKKFIIPILLGALAYFGFSGIFDNFHLPLGFIKANALENYDTTYTIDYQKYDIFDTKIDDTISYTDLFSSLNNIESEDFNLFIDVAFNSDYTIKHFRFTLFPKYMPLNIAMFGIRENLHYSLTYRKTGASWSYYTYIFSDYSVNDIFSDSLYIDFYNCFTTNVCNNYSNRSNLNGVYLNNYNNIFGVLNSEVNNESNFSFTNFYSSNYDSRYYYFIYSSQSPLYFSNFFSKDSSSYFYKKLLINNNLISIDDKFITYYDYLKSLESDDTISDETNHKKLFSKIFWLDDSNTEKGILSSIYILLFLYCLTMILFKIATLLKNKRW